MLPAETFQRRKHLLTLHMLRHRKNAESILKIYEMFMYTWRYQFSFVNVIKIATPVVNWSLGEVVFVRWCCITFYHHSVYGGMEADFPEEGITSHTLNTTSQPSSQSHPTSTHTTFRLHSLLPSSEKSPYTPPYTNHLHYLIHHHLTNTASPSDPFTTDTLTHFRIVILYIACIVVSIFLFYIMYKLIHRPCTYLCACSFFTVLNECHVARMQTKFCWSCPQHKSWASLS